MERFVAWLLDLSPATVYAVLGLSTFVENAFPPAPSDLLVTVGGFLTQHGTVSWTAVWLVAWSANLAGAVVVYLLARRFGRQFMASRTGRRLLPPDALVGLEREYLRFGVAGIFLSRFLPGFRSFVAPFVGLVNLPPLIALLPMATASAIWYAVLVWAGARVGQEWENISRLLGQLNRTLALIALAALAVIGYLVWRRRRARPPRRDRLLRAVHRALGEEPIEIPATPGADPAVAGAAALLYELARADHQITEQEQSVIADYLRQHWHLQGETPHDGGPPVPDTTQEMAAALTHRYERPRRVELVAQLYRIAASDGILSVHEERLIRRAASLLGLTPEDMAEARRRFSPQE